MKTIIPTAVYPGRTVPERQFPHHATPGSAGADLAYSGTSTVLIAAGSRALIPTGLAMAIPRGYAGMVCPRSGLALRHGLTVLNAPGIVDSDYRGEVGVVLQNLGHDTVAIEPGMRVAQLLIVPCQEAIYSWVPELDATTERGAGGFGSTGS